MKMNRLFAKLALVFVALAALYVYWLPNAKYAYATFTNTTHYNLAKPDFGTPGVDWFPQINQNFDIIDQAMDNAISNTVLGGELSGNGSNANVVSAGGVAVGDLLNAASAAGGDCTGTFGSLSCSDIVNGVDSGQIMYTPETAVINSLVKTSGTGGVAYQNTTAILDDNDYLDIRGIHAGYGIANHSGTEDFALTGGGTFDIINGTTAMLVSKESGGTYADATGGVDPSIEIGAGGAGVYLVMLSASFEGDNGDTFICSVFNDGVETDVSFHRKLGAGSDVGSAITQRLLSLSENDTLDIRCAAAGAGADGINFNHLDLSIIKVSR